MEKDTNDLKAEEGIQFREKLIEFLKPSTSSNLKGVQREATLLEASLFKKVS